MTLDPRRPLGITLTLLVTLQGLPSCKGSDDASAPVVAVSTEELPPMSVGTAQAIGPHRFAANV